MNGSGTSFPTSAGRFLWDVSGAFGDIGVLFPIAIALIVRNGFNPTALFLMAGFFYIASAWYFGITMPVQPLKAMSAIAIAAGLGAAVVNAAGIVMGLVLFALAFTGLSVRLGGLFPVPVIRGIQLGLGLMLVKTSLGMLESDAVTAVIAGALLMVSVLALKGLPPLIPLLALGIVLSLKGIGQASFGPAALEFRFPGGSELWVGFTALVLPQIALTFGNAIVSTEATAKILYGSTSGRLNLRSIPLSMAIANIVSGIVGGAPMCHGSGGLTAHQKFGATTERSGYIIGIVLIVLGLLFGHSAITVISAFPIGILGVLLCYTGVQHAFFIRDIVRSPASLAIALTCAVTGFMTGNLTIGFLLGIAIHYVLAGLAKAFSFLQHA